LIQLQKEIDNLSKAFRSNKATKTDHNLCLHLFSVEIKGEFLQLLVKLLNTPFSQQIDDINLKWHRIEFYNCTIQMSKRQKQYQEYVRLMTVTLFTRLQHLRLHKCEQVIEQLLPHVQVEKVKIESLMLTPRYDSWTTNSLILANVIQLNTSLEYLFIDVHAAAPKKLAIALSASCHLQSLSLSCRENTEISPQKHQRALSELIYDETGHQAVIRLLQNPNSQLQRLSLRNLKLDDKHLIAISQVVPTSKLKKLDIARNYFTSRGVLEFARHLPLMKCLEKVNLSPEHIRTFQNLSECVAALIDGVKSNTSIKKLDFINPLEKCKVDKAIVLLDYYCTLNRAGRRILSTTQQPVPLGLWSKILERTSVEFSEEETKKVDSIYFLLQNSPIPCNKRN